MLLASAGTMNELFGLACGRVLAEGRRVAPRGLGTVEVLGACLRLTDPRCRLVDVPPVRVLNPAFAVAEALWILAGSDAPWIYEYNARLRAFANDGRLVGAYGPRLRRWHDRVDQLDEVRRLLRSDPASRRAAVQLFDPDRDFHGYRDVPCTLGYRFYLRDGRLHMFTTMRSQDLWLGFCYDVFAATVLQELLAGWLDAEVGEYHHHVDSLHLYDRDLPAARRLPERLPAGQTLQPLAVAWPDLDELLAQLITGVPVQQEAWAEWSALMRSYRAWKRRDHAAARRIVSLTRGPLAEALRRWYDRLESRAVSQTAPLTSAGHGTDR